MDENEIESELHRTIVNELVTATPEWWDCAYLTMQFQLEERDASCIHIISNPLHPKDCVVATSELADATAALFQYYRAKGHTLVSAKYDVRQTESGDWAFKTEFEYR